MENVLIVLAYLGMIFIPAIIAAVPKDNSEDDA
jgi:hypothetical protein